MLQGSERVPTVVVAVSPSSGVAAVVDRIQEACRDGARFAVLIDARGVGDGGEEMDAGARRALVGRLRALRGDLKHLCAGVVFLAGPPAGERGRRLRAAGLLFGCPVHATASLDAAREWLAARGAIVPEGVQP